MSGPNAALTPERTSRSEISDEIGRAVGALWQRRSGARPASIETEWTGDVVRCTIEGGGESQPDGAGDEPVLPESRYEQEARASVRRLTGRSVTAFVAKPVSDSPAVTNAFILEPARTKN